MAVYAGQTNVHKEVKKLFIGFGGQWLEAKKVYLAYNDLWREAKVTTSFTPPHTNSLIFDGTSYLEANPISAPGGDRQKYIFSAWVYRSKLGSRQMILSARVVNEARFEFNASDQLSLVINDGGANVSDAVFRDIGWYQVGFIVDTTEPVADNRIKIMVNGDRTPSTGYQPPLNDATSSFNGPLAKTQIGSDALTNPGLQYNGGMTDLHFLDGIEMAEQEYFDTFLQEFPVGVGTNTMNAPKSVSIPSYGADGWNLKFENPLDFGEDSSGNGHDFSVFGFVPEDQITDVPGDTYAVLSAIDKGPNETISDGGLGWSNSSGTWHSTRATMKLPSGKFYFEATLNEVSYAMIGVGTVNTPLTAHIGVSNEGWCLSANATSRYDKWHNGSADTSYITPPPSVNDITQVAVDTVTGKIWFGVNGTFEGDPVAGTGEAYSGLSQDLYPMVSGAELSTANIINFGQRPFEFTPPEGFFELKSSNFPTPQYHGRDKFDVSLSVGTGAPRDINTPFDQIGLVWGKARSSTYSHRLEDRLRGAGKGLFSNTTAVEEVRTDSITSFNSGSFSLGNDVGSGYNENGVSYAYWVFGNDGTEVTNNDGTIPSQVIADSSGYMSIVRYTGSGSGVDTIGHGLGREPELVITKSIDEVNNWAAAVVVDGLKYDPLYLDLNNGVGTSDRYGSLLTNTVELTNQTQVNRAGDDYISYLFSSVVGLSKVFSYEGDGNSDGTFVPCGFKPRWILLKRIDGTGNWVLHDTTRDEENPATALINPNTSSAESSFAGLDITANGFKIRTTDSGYNTASTTYIGLAIAEEAGGGDLPWPLGR